MARGRKSKGRHIVGGLTGTDHAKERLNVIMQTLTGDLSVQDAQKKLGIGHTAFHKLREKAFQLALEGLEPGHAGRPRLPAETQEEKRIQELESELLELRLDLEASRIREEIAIAMPHLLERTIKKKQKKKAKKNKSKKRKEG